MSEQIVYKEGLKYPFVIINKLVLPGTDEVNFILLGPDQKKHLLPEQDYILYNLKVGQSISCTIDKINCSGKIFLEPDHPYYKIGERYDFLVLRISERDDFIGSSQVIAWVRDLHGLEWPCPIDSMEGIEPGYSHLACRVERIRRAELQLSLPALTSRFSVLKAGYHYLFKMVDIKTFEGEEYYILKDHLGNFHRLSLAYYKCYGFKINQEIKALVVRYNPAGEGIIEPEHPYYQIDSDYQFSYVRIERKVDVFGRIEAVILVEDIYNNLVKVKPEPWQVELTEYNPKQILCRVLRFKKGRPVLQNKETAAENKGTNL